MVMQSVLHGFLFVIFAMLVVLFHCSCILFILLLEFILFLGCVLFLEFILFLGCVLFLEFILFLGITLLLDIILCFLTVFLIFFKIKHLVHTTITVVGPSGVVIPPHFAATRVGGDAFLDLTRFWPPWRVTRNEEKPFELSRCV